jgi:hypothetical protein
MDSKQALGSIWKGIKVKFSISSIIETKYNTQTVIAKHRESKAKVIIKLLKFDYNNAEQMK